MTNYTIDIIPSDFRDFFVNSSESIQQEIVSSLLSLSLQESKVKDVGHIRALSVNIVKTNMFEPMTNSKVFNVIFVMVVRRILTKLQGGYNIKKKERLNRYLYCLLSGCSIRKSAKETEISIQISFDWHYKLLTSFSSESVDEFQGIVESDDLFFVYS
ncbi:hypothetical protein MKD41_01070 [Lutibacter sp. A64]|uniref:hypothetical protein n=1 Tax=Lutibacter sp. A64 TaxID=2918526 RepID=UPI001F069F23|nr:hypothetical protein [Lutibacter sp. A64]UMB54083.1 hypothetical protein MKD41_01070 [Lutibacter sp. A64]